MRSSTVRSSGGLGYGTVFELSPNGGGGWNEVILYRFCSSPDCTDGSRPNYSPVIFDSAGNLFGTTVEGGAHVDPERRSARRFPEFFTRYWLRMAWDFFFNDRGTLPGFRRKPGAVDELSTLRTMHIGVVPTSAVGTHLAGSRAAVGTRCRFPTMEFWASGKKTGLSLMRGLSSLVSVEGISSSHDLQTKHPNRQLELLPDCVQTQVDRTMPDRSQIGSKFC